jgi:hypothetical protein
MTEAQDRLLVAASNLAEWVNFSTHLCIGHGCAGCTAAFEFYEALNVAQVEHDLTTVRDDLDDDRYKLEHYGHRDAMANALSDRQHNETSKQAKEAEHKRIRTMLDRPRKPAPPRPAPPRR